MKERQRQAEETFRLAIDEGRNAPTRGQLRLVGPDDSFNLNPMLLHNISVSPYFQKCYNKIKDWSTLVDEIYYEVKHMEPWTPGKHISTLKAHHVCDAYVNVYRLLWILLL